MRVATSRPAGSPSAYLRWMVARDSCESVVRWGGKTAALKGLVEARREAPSRQKTLLFGALSEVSWGLTEALLPDAKEPLRLGGVGWLEGIVDECIRDPALAEFVLEAGGTVALASHPNEGLGESGIRLQARPCELVEHRLERLEGLGVRA